MYYFIIISRKLTQLCRSNLTSYLAFTSGKAFWFDYSLLTQSFGKENKFLLENFDSDMKHDLYSNMQLKLGILDELYWKFVWY